MCGDWINPVQHSNIMIADALPGFLCRQDISTHDIDYAEYVSSCLTWGRISTTCVMSMWKNGKMWIYVFLFPLKNSASKGLKCTVQQRSMKGLIKCHFKVSNKWQQTMVGYKSITQSVLHHFNSLRQRQNGCHYADFFLKWKCKSFDWNFIEVCL